MNEKELKLVKLPKQNDLYFCFTVDTDTSKEASLAILVRLFEAKVSTLAIFKCRQRTKN